MNGDGTPDLLVGSSERLGSGGQAGAVYLLDGRGNAAPGGPVLPGWPISMTSLELFPLIAEGVPNAGVIGRFEGTLAAVAHGNGSPPLLLPADPGTQSALTETPSGALPPPRGDHGRGVDPLSIFGRASKAAVPNTMLPLFAQPSLGDVDQDGTPDVIASGGSLNLALNLQASGDTGLQGEHLMAVWSGKTGAMTPGSPFVLEDYTFFNSQAIADLNGDDYPEVLTGSGGYFLHAFDGCGREPEGWPKLTGQWILSAPAIGDIDGDGRLEVAVGTRSGWLYAWHSEATEDSIVEWESFHHDNRNTGNLETALEQGGQQKAATPLRVEMCLEASGGPPVLRAGGGCDCEVAGARGGAGERGRAAAHGALAGLAGLTRLRRRRLSRPWSCRRSRLPGGRRGR
jgi:hypothetical protein